MTNYGTCREQKRGVPGYDVIAVKEKSHKYCVLIPVINEKNNLELELRRAIKSGSIDACDFVICDGGSTDGSNDINFLEPLGVTALLIKKTAGKQGAQLRMGFDYALEAGYEGFITIDGNNKDSIEDLGRFVEKLDEGFDFVQGSRFVKGGVEANTPKFRKIMVKMVHAPIISLTAHKRYTDTTNAYRAYSKRYICDPRVDIFRDIFDGYELLAYTSVRANQLKLKTCEIPVKRIYPMGAVPTKIKGFKGNITLFKILLWNLLGLYKPSKEAKRQFSIHVLSSLVLSIASLVSLMFLTHKETIDYSVKYNTWSAQEKELLYDETGAERTLTEEEKLQLLSIQKEMEAVRKAGIPKAPIIVLSGSTLLFSAASLLFYDKRKTIDGRKEEGQSDQA